MNHPPLALQHCQSRNGQEHLLLQSDTATLLPQLPGWQLSADGKSLGKTFHFRNFHHTLGFVNAVGFMANHEDHHPDMELGYGYCKLRWSTHDVGGLSLNDFICAARVEALLSRE